MGILKADMVGTWSVAVAAEVNLLHRAGANRGQQLFDALQPYAGTPAETPVGLDDMIDDYTLDAAAVDAVLEKGAIRGHRFLTALTRLGVPKAATITTASGTDSTPAVVTLNGIWAAGSTLQITLDTDTLALQDTGAIEVTVDSLPDTAAADLAPLLEAELTDVIVTANDNTLEFLAGGTATTVTVTGAVVG